MGVYLTINSDYHHLTHKDSLKVNDVMLDKTKGLLDNIKDYVEINESIFLFMGESKHKIKKKAEQAACELAIKLL